jgi:hypothetical protein
MLDAPKTLFFRRRHQYAVLYEGRRRDGVKSIEAEDNHRDFRTMR